MKRFFVDYYEMVWLNTWAWLKRHWVGYSLLMVMSFFMPTIVYKMKEKLDERKEEEES